MNIEKIINYVMNTPYNTNRTILIQMLQQLLQDIPCIKPSAPTSNTSVFNEAVIGDMIFGE